MDPITQKLVPGASGFIPNDYVEDVFSVDTWYGTGDYATTPASKKITNGINMLKHGGMVLNFQRGNLTGSGSNTYYKAFSDTDIGAGKRFWPITNNALGVQSDAMESFDGDGWTMGKNMYMNEGNGDNSNSSQNGAFTFRKQAGFFDMVTFTTGDGSNKQSNRRIPHSLKCKPGFILLKNQDTSGSWYVYHCKIGSNGGNDEVSYLSDTQGFSGGYGNVWGPNNGHTSTDFGIDETSSLNWWVANNTYTVYLWADGDDPDAKIFGKDKDSEIVKAFIGNGQNQFTNIGWEPDFLIIKNSGSNWWLIDSTRGSGSDNSAGTYNPYNAAAIPIPGTDGESNGYGVGFNQDGYYQGTFGGDCYCLAIRRPDHKVGKWATSPSECLAIKKITTPASTNLVLNNKTSGLGKSFDMEFSARQYSNSASLTTRWSHSNRLMSGSSSNEGGAGTGTSDAGFSRQLLQSDNDQLLEGTQINQRNIRYDITDRDAYIPPEGFYNQGGQSGFQNIFYMFKRKPGFFDMIKYKADVNPPTKHQLGVAPDLVITKSLTDANQNSYGNYWSVWSRASCDAGVQSDTTHCTAWLNDLSASQAQAYKIWTQPHEVPSVNMISLQHNGMGKYSDRTYMMYLWAHCDGIFHTGVYTGTGQNNAQSITGVGFSPRLLMIKNITAQGSWFTFDTARGLTSAGTPSIRMDSNLNEETGWQWIDPNADGFDLTNTVHAYINDTGVKYLYLAWA